MSHHWKLAVSLLLSIVIVTPLLGQEESDEKYKNKTTILPFASYSPETSLMFGGLFMFQFKPTGAGPETRASQILCSPIYTINQQLILEFIPSVILPKERWYLEGAYQYAYFPDNYWGVGSQTRDEDEINTEYRRINFEQTILKKLSSGIYAGLRVRWSRLSDIRFTGKDGGWVPSQTINGAKGSTLTGIGYSFRLDKRNSITAPTENHYLELTALFYPDLVGTNFPHQSWQLDSRKYLDLRKNKKSVLAFHFRMRLTDGELPFQEYSLLGGQRIMRGYYKGRFRDANAAQVQVELRQHIYRRLGFAFFISGGEVWNRFKDFTLNNPKYAAGVGLRFNLNPEDVNNIRIDYGIGKHDSGFYITIGESF